ncbi:hypothetical protein QL285_012486 [Trifolium repens]|nr:hypothetical protein QL285_012486 [Trifolium repens]
MCFHGEQILQFFTITQCETLKTLETPNLKGYYPKLNNQIILKSVVLQISIKGKSYKYHKTIEHFNMSTHFIQMMLSLIIANLYIEPWYSKFWTSLYV